MFCERLNGKCPTNKVCGEFPEFCYRAFDFKDYAESFTNDGVFRMGCQLSYKAIENKPRCDPTEGKGSIPFEIYKLAK